jgi:TM2 domain-containing membrane protein YozV
MPQADISSKSRLIALLLCLFLGYLGAHRFYVRKTGTAILMLCTAGGLGIWWLVDLIFVTCGSFRDKDGGRVEHWLEPSGAGA